jgi:hypothetical protein
VAWLNRGNKDITSFGFSTPAVKGSVQGTQIVIVMPAPTDVKALVAVFTVSGGQASVGNVPQISGATANDFSSPVLYTVTAQDGSTKTYTVTVTVPASPENPESAAVAPLPPSTP